MRRPPSCFRPMPSIHISTTPTHLVNSHRPATQALKSRIVVSYSRPQLPRAPIRQDQMSAEKVRFPSRILTIAKNAFREAVRDRILYNLVLFVLLITICAVFLVDLTAGQEARSIVNIGLGAILLFGSFISIFVGVSLVSKEIEKRTVYAIFSKPIGRGEFIVGKYLGLCLTLLVNVFVMGVGVSLALLYAGGGRLAFSVWGAILLI